MVSVLEEIMQDEYESQYLFSSEEIERRLGLESFYPTYPSEPINK
jgi:hypothetical protein